MLIKKGYLKQTVYFFRCCVAEPEPPGAATFRVEPAPIFLLAEAESRSRLFLASKKESLVVVTKHESNL